VTIKKQAFYAAVLHDFFAEHPDELDAKAGNMILVVTQSNCNWFLTQSIGCLDKPGLIPVSFVKVWDHATGKPILDIQWLKNCPNVWPLWKDWPAINQIK
jgi:bud emergence protein 1